MIALRRGVFQRRLDRQAGPRDVVSPNVDDGKRVRGRFNPGDVHLGELLDVMEHVAQLLRKLRLFLGREREPGELRHVVEVEIGRGRHGYFRICQGVLLAISS